MTTNEMPASTTITTGHPRLLRIDDVAERLSVSRSMAWKLVAIGELRSLRIGRAVRIRPEDLESYLDMAQRGI
jgi:excisionase family DNA binding protein